MTDLRRLAAARAGGSRTPSPVPPPSRAPGPDEGRLSFRLLLVATTGHVREGDESNKQKLERLFTHMASDGGLLTAANAPPRSPAGMNVSTFTAQLSPDAASSKLEVGSASGKMHFAASAKGFYRHVQGALLFCDASDGSAENLEELRNWHAVVHHTSTEHTDFVIVATRRPAAARGGEGKEEIKGEDGAAQAPSAARLYCAEHLPQVPYFELDADDDMALRQPLEALLKSVRAAREGQLPHDEPPVRPLPKNRWSPERHKSYPREFRDVLYLLLLNSQAHTGRAPNAAAKLPPVLWRQVFSFCPPLWFFTDRRLKAIKTERMELRQFSIEDEMEGSARAKDGQCTIA